MASRWMIWAGALFSFSIPLAGLACTGGDYDRCKKRFLELVHYRAEAIEKEFGDLSPTLPEDVEIKLVTGRDPEYDRFEGMAGYDRENGTLVFPRVILSSQMPNPLRWAADYWRFYDDPRQRGQFPVIETIDNALWSAYMQEAAHASGHSWPHENCASVEIEQRLSCEMLVRGVAEHIKSERGPIFNANRLDRIWPEDFSAFRSRNWRADDRDYRDVEVYGGILLIRPLIREFGVPRTLAYVARTPFRIEDNNLRVSALRYQDRARQALVW